MDDLFLKFLNSHCDWSRPVLIGLSGGPDSMALLHLLRECTQKKDLRIGVAHVNHCWRAESSYEAAQLEELVKNLGYSFHLKVLNPSELTGNLEDACRRERLAFFNELTHAYGYQAVILGHHRDDQAETVLKRFLEGASLVNLKGMEEIKRFGHLIVWRPLLNVQKKDILNWLTERKLSFFEDRTNLDSRFLRGKMRTTLIPYLKQEFGKEVTNSLIHSSLEAKELDDFLKSHLQIYRDQIEISPVGVFLDLSQKIPDTSFEIKQVIRYFLEICQMCLSASQMETAIHLIRDKTGNKRLGNLQQVIYFDRGRLFMEKKALPIATHVMKTIDGLQYGPWKIRWESCQDLKRLCSSWREVLQGSFFVCLPTKENYILTPPERCAVYPNTSQLDKWWTKHKIPAFLRSKIPVVQLENQIVHEFLTGKMNPVHAKMMQWSKMTFEYSG